MKRFQNKDQSLLLLDTKFVRCECIDVRACVTIEYGFDV